VRNGTGTNRGVAHPSEVGGWPAMASTVAPADADHDGMSDAWENLFGLKRADASDGRFDPDGDGYTNVEEFLNGTSPISANP